MIRGMLIRYSVALGILGGLALSPCEGAEPEPAAPSAKLNPCFYPEPVAKPGYVLSKERIGERGVAAYVLSADKPDTGRRPAVILIHGGGALDPLTTPKPQYKGEWFIPYYDYIPYRLAEAGMLVIAIDAWWAGERFTEDILKLGEMEPAVALIKGWSETAEDVPRVIDYLLARDDVDPDRIGVAGKSGGGIVSLMAACKEDRIEAVVAWKAGADFVEVTRLRGQSALMDAAFENAPGFRHELERVDPIHQYQGIPSIAVAFIGNHDDPLMPCQGAEALYAKLLPLYEQHTERLLLRLFETSEPTHDLQREAFELGCAWLEKHLGR